MRRKHSNPSRRPTVEQATEARLQEIRALLESGATEHTGRAMRTAKEEGWEATGKRFRGLKHAYPELERLKYSPSQIAKAIRKHSATSRVFQNINAVVQNQMEREGFEHKLIAPHEAYCPRCREYHSREQHRFHGPGAFHQRHLFSFGSSMKNPGIGRRFFIYGSFTSKRAAMIKEAKYPGSFIHQAKTGRYYVLKPRTKANPSGSKRLETIYRRVLSIQAQKLGFHRHCDAECKRVHHKYIHDFKPGAKLLGIPDGSFLMLKDGRTFQLSDGSMLVSDREY